MKITKRQLKRIIKEEKTKLLKEAGYVHDIFEGAAIALEDRDTAHLEMLIGQMRDMMMDEQQQRSYVRALEAMLEAAYELESMDEMY